MHTTNPRVLQNANVHLRKSVQNKIYIYQLIYVTIYAFKNVCTTIVGN